MQQIKARALLQKENLAVVNAKLYKPIVQLNLNSFLYA
jgi:hypothetical protein